MGCVLVPPGPYLLHVFTDQGPLLAVALVDPTFDTGFVLFAALGSLFFGRLGPISTVASITAIAPVSVALPFAARSAATAHRFHTGAVLGDHLCLGRRVGEGELPGTIDHHLSKHVPHCIA